MIMRHVCNCLERAFYAQSLTPVISASEWACKLSAKRGLNTRPLPMSFPLPCFDDPIKPEKC